MPLTLGYNTNGFAHHRLSDAIEVLAEIGYRSVAITLDVHTLNPFEGGTLAEARRLRGRLDQLGLARVVETGARYLLDPRRKHHPTLISADAAGRERRLDFLRRSIDVAAELGADVVSFWSGAADAAMETPVAREYLRSSCHALLAHAAARGIHLTFEPEPGMLVATMADWERLTTLVNDDRLGLTLDVGHIHCLNDGDAAAHIRHWRDRLVNVHIEDIRRGAHDHLMFGEGEMAFPSILAALDEVGYSGGVHVELSRHSHDAVNTARRAISFLNNVNR